MLCRCQRRWDMNLTSALARVEFESTVDMSHTTAKMICITLTTSRIVPFNLLENNIFVLVYLNSFIKIPDRKNEGIVKNGLS
jgi:hypothetical protein